MRRTALHLERSLAAGLGWVAFEPSTPATWEAITLACTSFLEGLFRQGAFQGSTAREAYVVRCDRSTMTAAEVEAGVVTVLVGFAPLKPAELVVLRLRLRAAGGR
ncbi:hypothetical protein [Nocardioides bruguierae]|uniref:Phage tail sheath family protein n=1 Tax=Nocardioides bruguierae TaxID=2945102 RepID=A0A9X2D4C1_9ACTN|nr:hypothetical protein [Nocardioides bruguierae]MCM0619137.1 hypothetical protein [Nocardioides bruguierae]